MVTGGGVAILFTDSGGDLPGKTKTAFVDCRQRNRAGAAGAAYFLRQPTLLMFGVIVMGLGANRGAIAAMLAVARTVIVAKVSWEWFERPRVRLGHRISYRKKAAEG